MNYNKNLHLQHEFRQVNQIDKSIPPSAMTQHVHQSPEWPDGLPQLAELHHASWDQLEVPERQGLDCISSSETASWLVCPLGMEGIGGAAHAPLY